VLAPCPGCGELTPLDLESGDASKCRACGVALGEVELPEEPTCCASCLREGRAAMTKDTELGMVRWEDAVQGCTHGLPGFRSEQWEVSTPNEDGWVRVLVPQEHLLELVRTPTYTT
jgi:hypothetical protein